MRFAEINSADERRIRGYLRRSQSACSSEELVSQFLDEFTAVVPADYICWHTYESGFSSLIDLSMTNGYEEAFHSRIGEFMETVSEHPMLVEFGFEGLWAQPYRMSDFAGDAVFFENPLYRDVYRHVDARYQLAYNVASFGGQEIGFTVNRWHQDFSEAERQKMHCLCLGLRRLLPALHERTIIERRLQSLTQALGQQSGIVEMDYLTNGEVRALGAVFNAPTLSVAAETTQVSLDTFKGRMASVREKLGLENTNQVRAALRDLAQGGSSQQKYVFRGVG